MMGSGVTTSGAGIPGCRWLSAVLTARLLPADPHPATGKHWGGAGSSLPARSRGDGMR